MAWGLWRIPESELHLLPPVRGVDVLELGCGAARWSAALARRGARPTGLDLSMAQLRAARRELGRVSRVGLVRSAAERIPFRDRSFDLVFCDWGALTFADPHRALPECGRVIRPSGHLVFAAASPIRHVLHDVASDRLRRRLARAYFGLYRIEYSPRDPVEYTLTYGGWIDLFRRAGFTVERLVEPSAAGRPQSKYLSRADQAVAREWPIECLWRLRRNGE